MNKLITAIGSTLLISGIAQADVVHNDDVIIDGSACIGFDCVNGENFGFDTLRLKENNLRIHFNDTSSSASFPKNDWRITVNDTSNGGGEYFAIEDATANRKVFRVDAGAPANALRIDSGGDVGIGVANPATDLHIRSGNTPTTRLEQDGSSGFTPQTWDVAGNEANFFIRDVTNGSKLPFKIKPGAPSNSLYIAADGDIGLGTASPDAALDVSGRAGEQNLFRAKSAANTHNVTSLDTTSAAFVAQLEFRKANATQWFLSSRNEVSDGSSIQNRFAFYNSAVSEVFTLTQDGKVGFGVSAVGATFAIEHSSGAHLTTGGVWTDASSRTLKNNIVDIELNSALSTVKALNPVTFTYNSQPREIYAGFIAEDVPELVATNDRRGLAPMDIVAVLTKVVQDQISIINDLKNRVSLLEQGTIE